MRRPILTDDIARRSLRFAFNDAHERMPFEIVAIVLLPDHLHTVWTLPRGDHNYSLRWGRIKEIFTREYLRRGGREASQSRSRDRQRYRGIWQKRFWEHTCEDESDLQRSVDYAHYNPVKHGYVSRVGDWPWSTFHRFVRDGEYEPDWGRIDPCPGYDTPEWKT